LNLPLDIFIDDPEVKAFDELLFHSGTIDALVGAREKRGKIAEMP